MTSETRPIIVGNWKMYKILPEAIDFVEKLAPSVAESQADVKLAVPFTLIRDLAKKVAGTKFQIGAQNMNDASEGAFTGEVSARMLRDAGAAFVLLGHSERRQYYKESGASINKKVKRALSDGLDVILCTGETFDEHESQQIEAALEKQLLESLEGLSSEDFERVTIAYEPIWAVGSGKAAEPADVAQENDAIRAIVAKTWGKKVGESLKILYGGSVTASNAKQFLSEKNINGVLVGSASLNVADFGKIIRE